MYRIIIIGQYENRKKNQSIIAFMILTSTIQKILKLQLIYYIEFGLKNSITAFKIPKVIRIEKLGS